MPSDTRPDAPPDDDSLVARAVRRRAGDRYAVAEKEVRRILDVGLELMRENPDGDVRIADITRRAEVSNDAFYRAFRSKSDLMAAIADEGSRRLAGYVRHAMGKQADPAERVRAGALAVLAQAVDQEVAATTVRCSATCRGPRRAASSVWSGSSRTCWSTHSPSWAAPIPRRTRW